MKRRRRCSNTCTSSRATLFFSCALATVAAAANCQRCSTSKLLRFGDKRSHSAFVISRPGLSRHQLHRLGRSTDATRPSSSGADSSADGVVLNDTVVHDDAWYLGDGGFASKYLEDEDRISAKKSEEDFFRERSLTVYDQMREASMLLLAQQQILAAEEAREEASRPCFVAAAAGGSAGARAQAIRDRQKKLGAAAGSLPSPQPPRPTSAPAGERGGVAAGSSAVVVPTDPATLSCQSLGVGGLEEEVEEIRRRVCVPLAAPVHLLEDLGISPVRGLLLHGPPGCGKTLLARRLSAALTSRPPTVVSGPEILERFVGSSEANVRALFDYPPEVPGGGDAEQAGALHVIVLDEFDSIGQRRGVEGSGNDGGDRVRDSVVNQLLARMDGFQELKRPTLLVALTNRIDLLDSALLRPGRFEVQIEIPGPNQAGREEILRIHTQRMSEANRIDTPAAAGATGSGCGYDELVSSLAAVTNGFTGAELAGLVRAAASYALERAVRSGDRARATTDCKVTAEDFGRGLADVTRSKTSAGLPMKGHNILTRRAPASTGDPLVRDTRSTIEPMGGGQAKGDRQRGADDLGADGVATGAVAQLDDGIDGSLSPEDLAAVQKLLQQKANSQKDQEDDLLLDAAQIVAQQRRSRARSTGRNVDGGDGKGQGSHRGKNTEAKKSDEGKEGGNSTPKRPTLRKFEHTGWFHTYE